MPAEKTEKITDACKKRRNKEQFGHLLRQAAQWEKDMKIKSTKTGWDSKYACRDLKETPSTLLIPGALWRRLHERIKADFGNCWRSYSIYLLNRYQKRARSLNQFQISPKLKKQYQETGLGLQRKNFRPDNLSWHLLKQIAEARGISICRMFVQLALFDLSKADPRKYRWRRSRHGARLPSWPNRLLFYSRIGITSETISRGIRMLT